MAIPNNSSLVFFVNGKKIVEDEVDPEWTLLYYLRNKLQLCGAKLGCGEGGCGACTVMVSRFNRKFNEVAHIAVNACLAPICSMHGVAVTTVEGIGSTKTKLHPVQERIAKSHGSQCGFCTPGIVMSMYTLLRNSSKPSMKDLETTFQGNLCRCTGYRPILEGFETFTEDWEVIQNGNSTINRNGICGKGNQCCKLQNGFGMEESTCNDYSIQTCKYTPYDPSQEPIFPPELKLYDHFDHQYLTFKRNNVTWLRPTQLHELLELKYKYPDAKIVVGNTEVGVEVKFKHCVYPIRIYPTMIKEMTTVSVGDFGVKVGAAVTLKEVSGFLEEQIRLQSRHKTRIFVAVVEMLHWFAGQQIRNVASVGGNIITGSPISDLIPIFIAAETELELHSKSGGCRKITMDENFFTSYRKTIIRNDEVLTAIYIPYTTQYQYFYAYKQARRRDDDTAIVNSAINICFVSNTNVISKFKMAFGGMGPTVVVPLKTCRFLVSQQWNENTLNAAYEHLVNDLPLQPDAPGGMTQYRRSLTLSFFFKAYLAIKQELYCYLPEITLDSNDATAIRGFSNEIPKASQYFQVLPSNERIHCVGKPIQHISSFMQASGEATYCDDIPPLKNELYMALVISQKAHARFKMDASNALNIRGVKLFISSQDIPADKNKFGELDSKLYFASDIVTAQGQILGAIFAENQSIAQQAARTVQVVYEEIDPVIITIEDAIKYKSFHGNPLVLEEGNIDYAILTAPHVIEGDCRTGCQEHFYLETQSVIAIPKNEDKEMEIICSTQDPMTISKAIASVLKVSENRIITKVRRLGGGFGGKEWESSYIAVPAAIGADKLGCPVRCMLDRDEDIGITGGRHPFHIKYKCAFDEEGRILGCEIYFYSNGGSGSVAGLKILLQAILKFDNAYTIPNVRLIGRVCKTNLPTNSAVRGFGAPQSILATEFMIREVAEYLNKDYVEIAKLNFYKDGDLTYYKQKLEHLTIGRCWVECIASSNFVKRRMEVEEYNRKNRWKKRGISVVPLKYGIALTAKHLNQAAALLHVYTDGSVLLNHGGVEMGQGLHTKMIQVAAQVLQIPPKQICVGETSTDKVPNATVTGGSISADLCGMAVMNACDIINERLDPYKKRNLKGKWEDWVNAAYMDRTSLSATGFYKYPYEGYDINTNSGTPFFYYTNGVGCSEVEIDCLTGDHLILRTDIVMDVGESLNPAIDVGQIEGAFMQGYGLYMIEELMYGPDGTVLTKGPGSYKLPGFGNTPLKFNVSLLKGAPNPRAIYSSKAIGEPPLCLASSILFAAREAIKAARQDAGVSAANFKLYAPVTAAKIRMACEDHLTSKFETPDPSTYKPWNVVP